MLVLSRKAGQELVLGDNVRITITKISGNRVTLGVTAPDDVRIIRGELETIVKSFEDDDAEGTTRSARSKRGIEFELATEIDADDPPSGARAGVVLSRGGPLADAINQF